MLEVFLITIGLCLFLATIVPLFKHETWWVRFFDFPRLQFISLLIITLAAFWWWVYDYQLYQTLFLSLLGVSIIFQAYSIFPYTIFSKNQVVKNNNASGAATISLMVSNVLKDNREVGKLKEIIDKVNPDVLLLVETNRWWMRQMEDYEKIYDYKKLCPLENTYGMLLYSRLELKEVSVKYLIEEDVPSIHGKVALESGEMINLHCLHPKPPSPTENEESTERDAELILVGKEVKKYNDPAIVLGDLNDVAWSHTSKLFQKISGLLDPRVGRGFYNTFNANYPLFRWPLDHIFHSDHFELIELHRLPYCGSDHFPIGITLVFNPAAQHKHEKPKADHAEKEEAEEKLIKAGI